MGNAGTVSFQSGGREDVFQVIRVTEAGVASTDEVLMRIIDPQFEGDKAWVTGQVPEFIPVQVEGDTSVIRGWFKSELYEQEFALRIYIEYEEQEVLVDACLKESSEDESEFAPQEVYL